MALGWLWPAQANAIPFDVVSNVPVHTFIDSGSPVAGSIPVGQDIVRYGVPAAELYFLFDYSQVQYVFTNYSSYTASPGGQGFVRRSTDMWYDPRIDSIVANVSVDGGTLPSTFYKYVHESYLGQVSLLGSDNNTYYTDQYVDYVDEFGLVMPLDSAHISDLIGTGRIDFTVSAGNGDFYFQLAKVTGTANDAPPAPVPEPSTLLLLSSGLAALGGVTWRQKHRG